MLRKSKVLPEHVLSEVLSIYQKKGMSPDLIDKVDNSSPLGRVLAAGLRNDKSSRYVMKEAIEEAGALVTHELERFLNGLGTIASIAPLMGLFGTAGGMIEIFGSALRPGIAPCWPPPASWYQQSPDHGRSPLRGSACRMRWNALRWPSQRR